MPHVIVKLWPGKTERQKTQLADRITQALTDAVTKFHEQAAAGEAR